MKNTNEKTEQINDSLSLISKTTGLTFGTDAYLLSAYVRSRVHGRAADLGSGTGVIALLCAQRGQFSHIHAVELQEEYCDIICRNAEENALAGRLTSVHCDIRTLTPDLLGGEVDAVFSNPPYMRMGAGIGNERAEKTLARHECAGGIGDFCDAAARILKFGGTFTVVFRPDRLAELLCAMKAADIPPKRMTLVYATTDHTPSLVLCEGKKGAADGMYTTKPLILTDAGHDSPDCAYIYTNGRFPDIYFQP